MSEPKPIARWQQLAALALSAAVVVIVALFRARIGPDIWPPDSSRVGPNLVAAALQAAVLFIALILLWPPWRARVHRLIDSKLAPLHARVEALHARHDEHAEHLHTVGRSLAELHAKLDALDPPAKEPPP